MGFDILEIPAVTKPRPDAERPSAPTGARGDAHAEDVASTERITDSALAPAPGMRDLLPPESRARRRVSEQLQSVFDAYGYELVTTPLFERIEVFERGLTLDPRDVLRFVDPDSGDVSAVRPDITPQIARVVSTRLADYPPPWRIRYEGTVVRRRRGRARRQRQIAQVGVELVGLEGPDADLEVIRLTSDACRAAGLEGIRIELSEVGVGRALLAEHSPDLLELSAEPLARKDETVLREVLTKAGVPAKARDRIAALAHLHGGLEVLAEAEKLIESPTARTHLRNLTQTAERLVALGLGPQVGVDLGEIRGAGYYTGVSFAMFAAGPGEAVASGGRYDRLLARYGVPQPATGAGIDLENLLWALDHAGAGWRDRASLRCVVAGCDSGTLEAMADGLRARGLPAATLPRADRSAALAYARAWGYDVSIVIAGPVAQATRVASGTSHELKSGFGAAEIDALAAWARAPQEE